MFIFLTKLIMISQKKLRDREVEKLVKIGPLRKDEKSVSAPDGIDLHQFFQIGSFF
jgi:hypothetical protein